MLDNTIYVRTYFRINTPSYFNSGNLGFKCEEDAAAFYSEVVEILSGFGFQRINRRYERSGDCPSMARGIESFYCHPQELTCYVSEGDISRIEEALSHANTFKHYKTDQYESMYNYTEDEFRQVLEAKRAELEAKMLERFKTKRRNLYVRECSQIYSMKTGITYIKHSSDFTHSPLERIENEFMSNVFDTLVEKGDIVRATKDGVNYYRTRSPRDPKREAV